MKDTVKIVITHFFIISTGVLFIISLSNLLFDADKRATEITKSLSQSAEQNQAPKQQKKQTQDMEMCF